MIRFHLQIMNIQCTRVYTESTRIYKLHMYLHVNPHWQSWLSPLLFAHISVSLLDWTDQEKLLKRTKILQTALNQRHSSTQLTDLGPCIRTHYFPLPLGHTITTCTAQLPVNYIIITLFTIRNIFSMYKHNKRSTVINCKATLHST